MIIQAAATVDWTQIMLQVVTTIGIIVVAFIVNKNRNKIDENHQNHKENSENTDGQLKEIHDLVNDRLDTALAKIEELRNELLDMKKQRDEAVEAAR